MRKDFITNFFKKSLLILIILLLSLTPLQNYFHNDVSAMSTDVAISNIIVTPYPNTPGSIASYTINFSFSGGIFNSQDKIVISGFKVGAPVPDQNQFLASSRVTVNNSPISSITYVPSGTELTLVITLNSSVSGNTVAIFMSSDIGIRNPSEGTYTLSVKKYGEDSSLANSQPYTIGGGGVSTPSVTVIPPLINSYAKYTVSFTTSYSGSLTANTDKISIQFPSGTVLPTSIAPSYITVNTIPCTYSPEIIQTSNTINITVPLNISYNSAVTVVISEAALIKNPSTASNYTLTVWTTKDITQRVSSYYSITASTITKPSVSISPPTVQSIASYEILFEVSSTGALYASQDTIVITFPSSTFIPSSLTASNVTVNGTVCTSIARGPLDFQITITLPVYVASSGTVSLVISQNLGIKNPGNSGSYTLKVHTSKDPTDVESDSFSIGSSKITVNSVSVMPSITNVNATYVINFSTGSAGALNPQDSVVITFPSQWTLPSFIQNTGITVNGVVPSSVSVMNKKVTIFLSNNVLPNQTVVVTFLSGAGIKNPQAGSYTLTVSTSKEPDPVTSPGFTISGLPETVISVKPDTPDGKNGYYITLPQITLSSSNLTQSVTIYYRIDSGAEQKYTAPFTIPEGSHTLYYHCEDSFGNKESEKSKTFNIDTTPPEFVLTSPKDDSIYYVNSYTISGTTAKENKVFVNDQQATLTQDGLFNYSGVFVAEGKNLINIVVEDAAGNKAVKTLSLSYVKRVNIVMQVGNKFVYVNGLQQLIDDPPFILDGRTMVPIRLLSTMVNAAVEWDSIFKIVTVRLAGKTIRVQVGNKTYDNNGKAGTLDVPPVIKDNITYVPLRLIIEGFGGQVVWDSKMLIISITYPKP